MIRIFTLEMIELLLECIGDRKEEEKILRSFFCHYDAYFALGGDQLRPDTNSSTLEREPKVNVNTEGPGEMQK